MAENVEITEGMFPKLDESQIARLAITAGRHSLFIYSVSVVMAIGMNLFLKRLDGGP